MASQGPNTPSTHGTKALAGNTSSWSATDRVTGAADDLGAYTSSMSSGQYSDHLYGAGFGFTIPSGSTIDGIVVEWRRRDLSGGAGVKDKAVRILKAGSVVGSDYATATAWATSYGYVTYGGSSDLWGTTWSVSEINAAGFGAAIAGESTGSGGWPQVDHARITVYYTVSAGGMVVQRRQSRTLRRM